MHPALCPVLNPSIQCKRFWHRLPEVTQERSKAVCPPPQTPPQHPRAPALSPVGPPRCGTLPRLEWPTLDDTDDFCFCLLTVIITCSWTRCFPVPLVFSLWSEGRASVELAWSWKHS